MRNVKEEAALFDALIEREETLIQIIKNMKEYYCSEIKTPAKAEDAKETKASAPKTEDAPVPKVKTYSKEEVRATLSQKAKINAECKVTVKGLVAKYSTDGTLTGVPAESYADLMSELEVVGNA